MQLKALFGQFIQGLDTVKNKSRRKGYYAHKYYVGKHLKFKTPLFF